ncbi:ATP phosphoribosyltransferase regulatory subunit [Candidatus Kinetoplastibacterium sorsogonicusi]|uniref:ATP phosphoribosyltransferase regulatory subunit n=1 Tax=Candidatus Kinetoplastidibacterium kentomonadis TaxID=1576550 RepID=A0A3S7J9Z7_9PROT|nr:ATP phosphoribosyltransferase regulatory subunit [Candidatus Kinetoplastibacterium sorsogonicusi]AWD32484.1 ATP phosphoribosyltransferase regulatory subunit [Candidatus Kinetoplastibacterium sorsogonicusi]
MNKWLLPENVADVLPFEARKIEELRFKILNLYKTHGFELVFPPLVEYIDSLLSGTGSDLNLRTCKLIDQMSGRTMGIRADITPQISRIDAHLINSKGVTRLCYCGNVLHAKPMGLFSSRELLQIGAEIYGYNGVEADIEIIRLVFATLEIAYVKKPHMDLCHHGIIRHFLELDNVLLNNSEIIISLLKEKDITGLKELFTNLNYVNNELKESILCLPFLYGNSSVILDAKKKFANYPTVLLCLDELQLLIDSLPDLNIGIDLADLGGYEYHSGVTFSVYAQGWHDSLVSGGRYDDVGLAFGRARPATGFSLDLRKLSLGRFIDANKYHAIKAPWVNNDITLTNLINDLRSQGEIVVQLFPEEILDENGLVFDRELVLVNSIWKLLSI